MQDTNQKIKQQLIDIYNKKSKHLPDWSTVSEVALLAKHEKNFLNILLATQVYQALKDLFTDVGIYWISYTKIDKKAKVVYARIVDKPLNMPVIEGEEIGSPKDGYAWDYFKKTTLQKLNKKPEIFHTKKYELYLIKTGADETIEVIKRWGNTQNIITNLDGYFLPVIEADLPKRKFENIIEEWIGLDGDKSKNVIKNTIIFDEIFFSPSNLNRDKVLNILKQLNIIDEHYKHIKYGPRQKEYLYGALKTLQDKHLIIKGDLGPIYKVVCSQISRPYSRISKPSENSQSAYMNGKQDADHLS